MKILALILTTALTLTAFANDQQRDQLQKTLAQKFLDIALVGADARENKQLYCDTGTYVSEITDMTVKAISTARYANDSAFTVKVLKTIKSNAALQSVVKSQISYRYALAVSTLNYGLEAEKAALIGSTMHGPAMGVIGNISEITFGNATSAKVVTRDWSPSGDSIVYKTSYVTYSVSQNADYQTIVTIAGTRYRLTFGRGYTQEYLLVPEASTDDTDAYRNGFVEFPSECEA
jgi:hypothetical protein